MNWYCENCCEQLQNLQNLGGRGDCCMYSVADKWMYLPTQKVHFEAVIQGLIPEKLKDSEVAQHSEGMIYYYHYNLNF